MFSYMQLMQQLCNNGGIDFSSFCILFTEKVKIEISSSIIGNIGIPSILTSNYALLSYVHNFPNHKFFINKYVCSSRFIFLYYYFLIGYLLLIAVPFWQRPLSTQSSISLAQLYFPARRPDFNGLGTTKRPV